MFGKNNEEAAELLFGLGRNAKKYTITEVAHMLDMPYATVVGIRKRI